MTKIALITDTHFGIRNDSSAFYEYQREFYEDVFFPTLIKNKITDIIHLGDMFDRRKYTNHVTLYNFKRMFFDKLRDLNINMHVIVGNHDVAHKNTNKVNTPELFLGEYPNINIYTKPEVISINDTALALCPWVNSDNYDKFIGFTKTCVANVLFGHYEIIGFEMHKGVGIATEGLDNNLFKNFKQVYSGHFHEPSIQDNIMYLGAPTEYTWSDFGCIRGFYLYEVESDKLEFVENPIRMFYKVYYADDMDVDSFNYNELCGKVVHVIVPEKKNHMKYDAFIDKLVAVDIFQLDVIDNSQYHFNDEGADEDSIKSENTIKIVDSYIDNSELSLNPDKLKIMFKELHAEAVAMVD